jgi:hypothetical protein
MNKALARCDFAADIKTISIECMDLKFMLNGGKSRTTESIFETLLKFTGLEEVIVFGGNKTNKNRADKWNMIRTFTPMRYRFLTWVNDYGYPPPDSVKKNNLVPLKKKLEESGLQEVCIVLFTALIS